MQVPIFIASRTSPLLSAFSVPGTVNAAVNVRKPLPLRARVLVGLQARRDLSVILPIPFRLHDIALQPFQAKTVPPLPASPILLSLIGKGTAPSHL